MNKSIQTSIIIPAYNEEAVIVDTLTKVADFIRKNATFLGACEVIVVAAGTGNTGALAQGCTPLFDDLKVITPKTRVGKGRDVRLGFLKATGDVQLFMDADLSTPLKHIIPMVEKLRAGAGTVIGTRRLSKIHSNFFGSLLSSASNLLTRLVISPHIRDTQCGFKGFRKDVANQIFPNLKITGWSFDLEVLALARETRIPVEQIPINDWHETRSERLRGDHVGIVAIRALLDLGYVAAGSTWRWCIRHAVFAPFLAMIAAFALALIVGPSRSIWFDEAYSIELIRQPLDKLIHFTSVDVHPPLYYIALKFWAFIFGDSEFGLRSLSMVCGALASGVAVMLARYMFGGRAALIALPFVTVSPFLLRYDIEARMYALASLICITATYVLVRALDASNRRSKIILWSLYAILVAAGMYTQYYTVLIWTVHFIWCLALVDRKRSILKNLIQPWLFAYALAIALYIPWIHHALWQLGNVQNGFWIGPVTIREVLNVGTMFMSYHAQWQLNPTQSLVTMIGIGSAIWLIASASRAIRSARQQRYYLLLVLCTVVPIALLYLASLPPLKPIFLDRYFSHTLLAGYLLIGIAVALQASRRKAFIAGAAVLLVLTIGVGSLMQQGNYNYNTLALPQTDIVADYLKKQNINTNEPIVIDSPGTYFEFKYYMPVPNLLFYSPQEMPTNGGYAPLHNSPSRLASGDQLTSPKVWYVYSRNESPRLELTNYKLVSIAVIGNHKVATYERL
jgi:hypothetical protein